MRVKTAKINVLVSIMLQVMTLLYGLLLPRYMIVYYGSEVNGLLTSVKTVLSSFTIVEAGLSLAVLSVIYLPIKNENTEYVSNILTSARKSLSKSSFLYLLLLIVFICFSPILSVNNNLGTQTMLLIFLIGITTFWDMFIGAKYAILIRGHNKEYIVSTIQMFITLMNILIVVVFLNGRTNLTMVYFLLMCTYSLRPLLLYLYVKNNYKYNFNYEGKLFTIPHLKSSFIHQFATLVFVNTDIVLITIFFDFKTVSVYTVYMMIFTGLSRLLSVFTNGLQPGFGQLMEKDHLVKLNDTYNTFEFIYYNIMGITYVTTLVTIMNFMKIYIGNQSDINYQVFHLAILLVISEFLSKIRVPASTLVIAGGFFKQTQNAALIEVVINVIISLIGIMYFGFIGVIFGTIVAMIYRIIHYVLFTSRKILLRSSIISSMKIIKTILISVVVYLVISHVDKFHINNIFQWIIYAGLVLITSSVLFALSNLLINPQKTMQNLIKIKKIVKL